MTSLSRRYLKIGWRQLLAVLLLVTVCFIMVKLIWKRTPSKVRVIGYSCLGDCGGWADRQKGMVVTYIIAKMLDKEFKIMMTHPCELAWYLSPPGLTDWRVSPNELDHKSVEYIKHVNRDAVMWGQQLAESEDMLADFFSAEYTFLTINMELVFLLKKSKLAETLPWLQQLSVPDVYKFVLQELFQLMVGPMLNVQAFSAALPPSASLVCAQIRVGGGRDSESFNTLEQVPSLVSFLAPYNNTKHRFLITSDSAEMVKAVQSYFPSLTVQIEGPITHVDQATGSSACDGLRRVIVEQHLMAGCDILVISESGLGRIAAFMRGTDTNLYIFHDNLVRNYSRLQDFPHRDW